MQFMKDLVFGISCTTNQTYGGIKIDYDKVSFRKYIHELKKTAIRYPRTFIDKPFDKYAYITGRIKRGMFPCFDKYLMLLDSDSREDAEQTINWLNKQNIRHIPILSSPDHYWIVCNKIGTVNELTYIMDEIPGIDVRYTDCSRKQNILLYRGFPKPGFTPKFDDSISMFTGNGAFEKWVLNFKMYWELDDINEIANYLFLENI